MSKEDIQYSIQQSEYNRLGPYHRSWTTLPFGPQRLRYDLALKKLPQDMVELSCLDYGGGDGALASLMAERKAKVTVIDPMRIALNYAKDADRRIALVEGMTNVPFGDSCFDVVTFIETLEHIPDGDDVIAIEEIERVLKPDGLLLLTVPHCAHRVADKHYRHYSIDSLTTFVHKHTTLNIELCVTFRERFKSLTGKLHGKLIRAGFYIADQVIRSVNGNLGMTICEETNADGIFLVARKLSTPKGEL